jgi:hypothetical protein
MPSYDVTVIHYHTVSLTASDKDEAADIAIEMESHGECWEMEVDEISLVEEDDPECSYSPYCISSPASSGYVAYTGFSHPTTMLRGTTLSNGYTTYC